MTVSLMSWASFVISMGCDTTAARRRANGARFSGVPTVEPVGGVALFSSPWQLRSPTTSPTTAARRTSATTARRRSATSERLNELDRCPVHLDERDANLPEDVERLGDRLLAFHRLFEALHQVRNVRHPADHLGLGALGLIPEPFDPVGVVGRAREPEALRLEEAHAVSLCGSRNADVIELHGARDPNRRR